LILLVIFSVGFCDTKTNNKVVAARSAPKKIGRTQTVVVAQKKAPVVQAKAVPVAIAQAKPQNVVARQQYDDNDNYDDNQENQDDQGNYDDDQGNYDDDSQGDYDQDNQDNQDNHPSKYDDSKNKDNGKHGDGNRKYGDDKGKHGDEGKHGDDKGKYGDDGKHGDDNNDEGDDRNYGDDDRNYGDDDRNYGDDNRDHGYGDDRKNKNHHHETPIVKSAKIIKLCTYHNTGTSSQPVCGSQDPNSSCMLVENSKCFNTIYGYSLQVNLVGDTATILTFDTQNCVQDANMQLKSSLQLDTCISDIDVAAITGGLALSWKMSRFYF